MKLRETSSGRPRGALVGAASDRFTAVAVAPDGRLLAALSQNGVTLWDTTTRRKVATTPGYGRNGTKLSFTEDGRFLRIRSRASMKLWDTRERREETAFGHDLLFADVSQDGKLTATSGSQDIRFFGLDRANRRFTDT